MLACVSMMHVVPQEVCDLFSPPLQELCCHETLCTHSHTHTEERVSVRKQWDESAQRAHTVSHTLTHRALAQHELHTYSPSVCLFHLSHTPSLTPVSHSQSGNHTCISFTCHSHWHDQQRHLPHLSLC